MANPTKADFRRALKGRKALVMVAGTEVRVFVAHSEAMHIWAAVLGNLGWSFDGDHIYIETNADETFGRRGGVVMAAEDRPRYECHWTRADDADNARFIGGRHWRAYHDLDDALRHRDAYRARGGWQSHVLDTWTGRRVGDG